MSTNEWIAEDPDPISEEATPEERAKYEEDLKAYCKEMFEWFQQSQFENEPLWIEVHNTFREHTIRSMTKTMLLNWIQFLLSRGVHVNRGKGIRRVEALVQCLKHNYTPLTIAEESEDKHIQLEATQAVKNESTYEKKQLIEKESVGSPGHEFIRKRFLEMNETKTNNDVQKEIAHKEEYRYDAMGINGMIKSYQGRKKFSGAWDENLEQAISTYETFARVCKLSEQEMAEAIPYMLCDDAFLFFSTSIPSGCTYGEIIEHLKKWYTSSEKKARILRMWQAIRLSEEMAKAPDKSQVEVFRSFSFKLTTLQKQLSEHYHHDDFLRDQFLTSVDHPQIQQSLRERVPESSQEAANRITTFLSDRPQSAASFTSGESTAMYSLGMRYGGDAEGINYRRNGRKDKRLSSNWIKGVKGCYVCGKNHLAATRHSPHEVREAIKKLKNNHPRALLSVEDLAFITNELNQEDSEGENIFESDSDHSLYAVEKYEINLELEKHLANAAFQHGRKFNNDLNLYDESKFKSGQKFKGIMFDTCANRSSIISYSQYKLYCKEFEVPFNINWFDAKSISGIGGTQTAMGTVNIPIPFRDLDLVVDIKFQVMKNNVPTLLSMKDMIDNNLDLRILEQSVRFQGRVQKLLLENYFLIYRWNPSDQYYSLYTETELKRLHRVFGHPSVNALGNLLKRANPDEFSPLVRSTLEDITKRCEICTKYSSKPRRFKLTVGTDELQFNHVVAVDIMYISGKAVVHLVDEATHFTAAQFIQRHTTSDVWKAIMRCWIRTYLGPPDFLHVDQGSNLVSEEFKGAAQAEGISVKEAPIESPGTMSHVERYHAPLKVAYTKIRASLGKEESNSDCLQLAVKSVNDTIGPEGLCPTLLVFGTLPRPARSTPSLSQLQRAKARDLAIKEIMKEHAKQKLAFGLKHNRSPKGKEKSQALHDLPAGAPVYVYRERSDSWEGPFPFISIDGETVVVQLPRGRKLFRSSVVKPKNESVLNNSAYYCDEQPSISKADAEALFGSTEIILAKKKDAPQFKEARKQELDGLLKNNTFKIVKRSSVPANQRVYGSRFIDAFKTVDGEQNLKSRLVAQNYNDEAASKISTNSPTISRVGQRTCVALTPCYKKHKSYLRDITQAYPQADTELERLVYLEAPEEMNLAEDEVLLVVKALYGIPESGLHWFVTFQGHHLTSLNMVPSRVDPCLLSSKSNGKISGICAIQVDDVFGHGTDSFLDLEENVSAKFKSKPRKVLEPGDKAVFNGTTIAFEKDNSYSLSQREKLEALQFVTNTEEFHSTRAKLQYIGVMTRPDLCAQTQLLANGNNDASDDDIKNLNKIIKWARKTSNIGLKYKALDLESTKLALFCDSSFANARNLKSQMGFVVVLVDKFNNASIINYGSARCQRVTRSVMASEIHGLLYGFDNAIVTQNLLHDITGIKFPINAFIDSKTLFNVVAKDAKTLEKRLQIDVWSIRESLKNCELKTLSWIPSQENIADALTKGLISESHALWKLMNSNKIYIDTKGWVENVKEQISKKKVGMSN